MTSRDPSTQREWYAVHTRHQHEKAVAHALSEKGFEVFLPLYAIRRKWKDRVKLLSQPLFPSYVFLRASIDCRIAVLRTSGVHQFIGFGGVASAIPEEEIEAVRRTVGTSLRVEPYPFLRNGDRVRVRSGPLVGIEGILVGQKNQWRLVVSIEMLSRSVAVEMQIDEVEKFTASTVAGYLTSTGTAMATSGA